MKSILTSLLLLLLLTTTTRAQQGPSAAPADTILATDTSARSAYALGEVITPEGRLVKAYFPKSVNGFAKSISFYYTNPEAKPAPKPHFIGVDKIRSMTVREQYAETLTMNGKSLHVLAARLVNGPVELFNFAESKGVPLLVPVPLVVAGALIGNAIVQQAASPTVRPIHAIPYTKNHWYLRRGGELVEVRRGRFEEQISEYLSAQPALAAKVKAKTDGYQYQDMVRIIGEYNQQAGASAR